MLQRSLSLIALIVGAAQSVTFGQFLLIPESTNDRVIAVSAFDGSLLNPNFLDIAPLAANAGVSSTPIEVLEVGDELWVSDQVADRIWRFDNSGAPLSPITSPELNNIRGMEVVGNTVYVAQGSAAATFGEGLVTVDVATASVTGIFNGRPDADVSYQDVKFVGGELLVTNSDTGNDGIDRYLPDGTFLGTLVSSDGVTGLDFGQQINVRGSNGNLLVGGFSPPSGVYEFLPDGTSLGIVAGLDFGPRAGYELGNGSVLWTNGNFVATDAENLLTGDSYRYITPSRVPEPASLALLFVGGIATLRRRR